MTQNEALGRLTKITQLVSSNKGKRQSVCVCVCVRERERERETDRQTDRQTQKGGEREEKNLSVKGELSKLFFCFSSKVIWQSLKCLNILKDF